MYSKRSRDHAGIPSKSREQLERELDGEEENDNADNSFGGAGADGTGAWLGPKDAGIIPQTGVTRRPLIRARKRAPPPPVDDTLSNGTGTASDAQPTGLFAGVSLIPSTTSFSATTSVSASKPLFGFGAPPAPASTTATPSVPFTFGSGSFGAPVSSHTVTTSSALNAVPTPFQFGAAQSVDSSAWNAASSHTGGPANGIVEQSKSMGNASNAFFPSQNSSLNGTDVTTATTTVHTSIPASRTEKSTSERLRAAMSILDGSGNTGLSQTSTPALSSSSSALTTALGPSSSSLAWPSVNAGATNAAPETDNTTREGITMSTQSHSQTTHANGTSNSVVHTATQPKPSRSRFTAPGVSALETSSSAVKNRRSSLPVPHLPSSSSSWSTTDLPSVADHEKVTMASTSFHTNTMNDTASTLNANMDRTRKYTNPDIPLTNTMTVPPPPPPRSRTATAQSDVFTASVVALNTAFATFVASTVKNRPAALLTKACTAYITHVEMLRSKFGAPQQRSTVVDAVNTTDKGGNTTTITQFHTGSSNNQRSGMNANAESDSISSHPVPTSAASVPNFSFGMSQNTASKATTETTSKLTDIRTTTAPSTRAEKFGNEPVEPVGAPTAPPTFSFSTSVPPASTHTATQFTWPPPTAPKSSVPTAISPVGEAPPSTFTNVVPAPIEFSFGNSSTNASLPKPNPVASVPAATATTTSNTSVNSKSAFPDTSFQLSFGTTSSQAVEGSSKSTKPGDSSSTTTPAPIVFSFGSMGQNATATTENTTTRPSVAPAPAPFVFGKQDSTAPFIFGGFNTNTTANTNAPAPFTFGSVPVNSNTSSSSNPATSAPITTPAFVFGGGAAGTNATTHVFASNDSATAPTSTTTEKAPFVFGSFGSTDTTKAVESNKPSAPFAAFSFGGTNTNNTSLFGGNATSTAHTTSQPPPPSLFSTANTSSFGAATSTDANAAGDAEGEDGANVETELVTTKPAQGEPPIPLLDDEEIAYTEPKGKVLRYVLSSKTWAEAGGVGTVRIIAKKLRGTGGRVVVSQDIGTREKVMLSVALYTNAPAVELGQSPDGTKPGGLSFVGIWAVKPTKEGETEKPELTRFMLRVKTAAQEAEFARVLRSVLGMK